MNLFLISILPKECIHICDKHIVKMPLETAQMLYTAHHLQPGDSRPIKPYRATHKNHPIAVWSRLCKNNYIFTARVGIELCKEYTFRYGKRHACQDHLDWLLENLPSFENPEIPENYSSRFFATQCIPSGCTPFPLAMPKQYHEIRATVAYKKYLAGHEKAHFSNWSKNRSKPLWFVILTRKKVIPT